MIISFAWTTEALLAGRKSETRRFWNDEYAERFAKRFREGKTDDAYDKSARFGGKKVATIRLVKAPYKERLADMSDESFEAEGGTMLWKDKAEYIEMMGGKEKVPWVVKFEVVKEQRQEVRPEELPRIKYDLFYGQWTPNRKTALQSISLTATEEPFLIEVKSNEVFYMTIDIPEWGLSKEEWQNLITDFLEHGKTQFSFLKGKFKIDVELKRLDNGKVNVTRTITNIECEDAEEEGKASDSVQ